MLVQFTMTVDGREVGVESRQVSGTAAQIEEQLRQMQQRTGRMALEPVLMQVADQTPAPRCCGRAMESRGWRGITVRTTFGEIPVSRRVYSLCGVWPATLSGGCAVLLRATSDHQAARAADLSIGDAGALPAVAGTPGESARCRAQSRHADPTGA